jgi:hypothetical protein
MLEIRFIGRKGSMASDLRAAVERVDRESSKEHDREALREAADAVDAGEYEDSGEHGPA